jgi:tRNA (cmo5U34)-methyltransferase
MTTVSDYFKDHAPKYDSFTLRAMPRYEEMLGEIVRCLPGQANDILELGCGTGSLTALLTRHYANSAITAIDASAEMMELARERLGSLVAPSEHVAFVESLFEELDLPERAYDLIASNMSLHHIVDKGPFYRRLHESLRPGGTLVLGDELVGALPRVQQLNWDGWLRFARDSGGLGDSEIEEIVRHEREFDHYETLLRQLELLGAAGFGSVDCVWRYLNYAVFVAQG